MCFQVVHTFDIGGLEMSTFTQGAGESIQIQRTSLYMSTPGTAGQICI